MGKPSSLLEIQFTATIMLIIAMAFGSQDDDSRRSSDTNIGGTTGP